MVCNFSLKQIIVVLFFSHIFINANAQTTTIHISGRVISNETQNAIEEASIQILAAQPDEEDPLGIGTVTKRDGTFDLYFPYKFPFKIRVSHVSYRPFELIIREEGEALNLIIPLSPNILGEDLYVTAPLATETEMKQTKTIDRLSTVDVQQLASFDVYDLVSTLREVDVATQSMTMQSVNTRGFNASANKRFLQLTDGIDNRAPGLSFPIGNLMGLPDVDVSSVEILPGPSSTQYGSSALNGVLLMNSRDPFEDQGISAEIKAGVNNLNLNGSSFSSASGDGMYDIQGRYAKAFNDKFAFKVTGVYTTGVDWVAENYDNIGYGKPYANRNDQPGYNGVNTYGDEDFVYLKVHSEGEAEYDPETGTFIIPPANYGPVTRTGYREADLVDYGIETLRTATSLQYKFSDNYKIKLEGKYGNTNSIYTGDTRVRLSGFKMYQTSLELQLNRLNIHGYSTWQNSGNSYDVTSLADILIQSAKKDADWFRDYLAVYETGFPGLGVPPSNTTFARRFADSQNSVTPGLEGIEARFEEGTPEFREMVQKIINSQDQGSGAAIRDNSKLYHVQSSYQVPDFIQNTKIDVGGNFRFFDLSSGGTIFPDTASNNITNYEVGAFIKAENSFLDDDLNINSAVRFDKNESFDVRISPQFSVNYALNDKHFFRFSYQYGFRYPGVREQFVNDDLGPAYLIGGLKQNVAPLELQGNAFTQDAVNAFNRAVTEKLEESIYDPVVYNRLQAEIESLPILEDGILAEDQLVSINPEVVNSFEVGYKQLITPQLYLDLNSYVSFYQDFIGVTRVVKPRTSPSKDLLIASGQINNSLESDRYYVYSNAQDEMTVIGASFALDYISGGFFAGLNGSYSRLIQSSTDPITPGFNTPPFKMNFEWGNREFITNVGFKMTYRYRTAFFWESSFIDGPIDMYGHFDFQFNVRLPEAKSTLKFGVTNLGVDKYYNIFGGPSIGSILFATLNFNPKMFQ